MKKKQVIVMRKKQELVKVSAPKVPAQLIELAIEKGNVELDKVEKLLRLLKENDAYQAKKVYNSQMVLVQGEMPTVTKTLKNSQTQSKYASLDEIIATTKKVYTKHGFSISFYEGTTEVAGCIRICADVVHSAGHKETYHYDVPLDGVGIKGNANMTAIHAKASSTSYARRYLMCMIWNIPTEDDDGNKATPAECITEAQEHQLLTMIADKKVVVKTFCEKFKIEKVAELPKNRFQNAIVALEAVKPK